MASEICPFIADMIVMILYIPQPVTYSENHERTNTTCYNTEYTNT